MARMEKELAEEAYRVYVTDSLQVMPQHKYKTVRYYDILHPQPNVDCKTVVNSVVERAGLEIVE